MPLRLQMMRRWLTCALMVIGALAACTPAPTPVVIPTLTLIPSTATFTAIPPTAVTPATQTPVPTTPTPTTVPITTILQTTVTPDADLTQRIVADLARRLNTAVGQVQLVTIEVAQWYDDQLGCDAPTNLALEDAVATLQIGVRVAGLRYVLLVGNTLHEYHTDAGQRFVACEATARVTGDLLVAVDPVAADMVALVQRRLAGELDLSTRRIQLVDVAAYVWADTSLGCPQPEQTYTTAEIPGYRIVVSAGGNTYAYHSDSTTVIRCPDGREVLPG